MLRLLPRDDYIVIMFLLQFVIISNFTHNLCILFYCSFIILQSITFLPNFVTCMYRVCNWTRDDSSMKKSRNCETKCLRTKLLVSKICWIHTFQLNFYYFCTAYLHLYNKYSQWYFLLLSLSYHCHICKSVPSVPFVLFELNDFNSI